MKKILARVLVVCMLWQSHYVGSVAFVPLVVAGSEAGFTFASATSIGSFMMYATAIVGTAVGWVGFGRDPSAASSELPPIVVQLDPTAPLPTPSGWTAPVAPAVEPKAPNTATYQPPEGTTPTSGTPGDCGSYTAQGRSLGGAIYTMGTHMYQCPLYDPGLDSPLAGQGWTRGGNWNGYTNWSKPIPVCATGYTLSGGQCVATAGAVAKPSDGKCSIKRSGNTFSADPMDPDCATMPATIDGANEVNIIESATLKTKVKIEADGKVTMTREAPNGSNTDKTTVTTSAPAGAGTVTITGKGTQTIQGQGTQQGSPVTPTTSNINIPTDYAREATLSQIKAGQCGGAGQPACKIDETGTPTNPQFTDQKGAIDKAGTDRQAQLDAAGSVSDLGAGFSTAGLFPSSCGCSALALTFKGWSGGYNWCPIFGDTRILFGWFYGLIGALYFWRRATSGTGGGGK